MDKAERIHKILNRENGYFLFIKSVTGETIGSQVDNDERRTYIAYFNEHNQIDEVDEKTKQECINRIRTNEKRIDNLQYDYLNLSIRGWFFNLKEIMSFQELGETEYLMQINEAEYIRLRREIDKLTVEQTKYENLDPEYKSIGTKIEEFNQRRSQFTDWFMAKNLGIPNYSSEIKATAQTRKAETETRKEKTNSTQKAKSKPAHRPTIKITEEGLLKLAGLNKRLKAKEEGLSKEKVKAMMAKEYDCDPYAYFNWLKRRIFYVDKDVWELDENDMKYLWENYYTLPAQEKD